MVLSCLVEFLLDPSGAVDAARDRRRERRNRQRARTTKIPGALRVLEGRHPGLGRRWKRGAARVPAGVVVFEPDSSWRRRMTVPVRAATLQPRWASGRRIPRGVGPLPRRIELRTEDAVLEWVVPEAQVPRAMTVTRSRVPRWVR